MDGYRFRFASQSGSDYTIYLRPTTGWSGQYKTRAMGASPVLRRERNGAILGSSLTLRMECVEDNEFVALYTSSPYEWLAEVYLNGVSLVWRGYVSPELYSAPDMAPPYDVEVIATDGLGELKRADYTQDGPMTLHDILKALLHTAQQDDLPIMWRLNYSSDGCNGSNYLTAVSLDLTSQSGRSCYEVLSDLLASMHAMVMYDQGAWIVVNECDLPTDGSALTLHNGDTGNDVSLPVQALGGAWWPVGKLSDKVVPAKPKVTLATTAVISELMPDPTLTAQGGAGQMEDGVLLGGSGNRNIKQEVYVGNVYAKGTKLLLEIEATGDGSLVVNITGKTTNATAGPHGGPWTVGSVVLQDGIPVMTVGEGGSWISGEPVLTEVKAITPDRDKLEMSLVLPDNEVHIYAEDDGYGGVVYSLGAMHDIEIYLDTIIVQVSPHSGTSKVTRMSLREVPRYSGTETTVKLGNGARDAGESVDILASSDIDGVDAGTLALLREGVMMRGGKALRKWGSSYDYVAYMGIMYARSNALPAVDKTGILNVPSGTSSIPLLWQQSGVVYMLRRYDWSLIADELTINEMVSLPVATLTVECITTVYTSEGGGTSRPSGSSSGGSGGGSAAGVSSVGLEMPEPYVVEGSPLTTGGIIRVSLKDGYKIPATTEVANGQVLYNELMSGWLLSAPPRINIVHGTHEQPTIKYMEISHPLLRLRPDAEVVLMVYGRNRGNYSNNSDGTVWVRRKRWFVAIGFKYQEPTTPLIAANGVITVDRLTTYIVRHFTGIAGKTRHEMLTISLDAWQMSMEDINWGEGSAYKTDKCKRFGWAVRVPNPAFSVLVDPNRELNNDTQSLRDANNVVQPRYYYTAVAPMLATLNDERNNSLTPYNHIMGYGLK